MLREKMVKAKAKVAAKDDDVAMSNTLSDKSLSETSTTYTSKKRKQYIELRTSHYSDAMLRLKRRKTVFASFPVQLEVEIHNEGIVLLYGNSDSQKDSERSLSPKVRDEKDTGQLAFKEKKSEFVPHGSESIKILHALSLGLIPDCMKTLFDPRSSFMNGESFGIAIFGKGLSYSKSKVSTEIDGLLIKALITDYRIPEQSARAQRSKKFWDIQEKKLLQQIEIIEKHHNDLLGKAREIERNLNTFRAKEGESLLELRTLKKASDAAKRRLKADWQNLESNMTATDAQKLNETVRQLQNAIYENELITKNKTEILKRLKSELSSLRLAHKRALQAAHKVELDLNRLKNKSENNLLEA